MDNSPKKVIILGTAWPFRGGLAAFNERLAQEFVNHSIECQIVTFTTQYPSILFPGKTQYSEEEASFKNIKRKLSSVNPLSWWTTANYINKQKPDLLIVKFWLPFMGPAFGTVLRLLNKNIRKICILDNVIPHEKRFGDKIFTNYLMKTVHSFVAMSKSVKEDLKIFTTEKRCILNPHPVFDNFGERLDAKEAKDTLGLNEKEEYVLFFGFIRKYKGLDLALEAFSKWRKELPNVKLLVAGEFYDNEEYYKTIARDLGIENEVLWHTYFIDDSKVKNYFSAARLVLQPYHHATQSGVTQIAYQFEQPMIVTRVGGLPELIDHGKTGYLVEKDEQEIADRVIEFFKGTHQEIQAEMKEAKKRFSWSAMVGNILTLYRDLKE